MKELHCSLLLVVVVAAVIIVGCVPGIKSIKNQGSSEGVPGGTKSANQSTNPADSSKIAGKDLDSILPPPPPSYKPAQERTGEADQGDILELRQKDEINDSALRFAKEVPNVKYVKTCFSKIYGGWYLLLYIEKGKKISLQQYSWNPKSREWEVVYHIKEVPVNQLEFHLKGEVGDEKCFVLKK